MLLEMAGLLLSAESLEGGIQGTLERLGGFYGADRCYVVQARLGERTFQAAQQWQSPALQAQGNAAAQTLEGAGWLEHLKAPPPGGLPRRGAAAAGLSREVGCAGPGVQSFYAVALLEEGSPGLPGHRQPPGAVGVHHHASLPVPLSDGGAEQARGKAQNAFLRSHDALTGCLNWERYNDYLVAFSNDVSSSLGVLRADVNQLAELNQRRGKEAGDRMVLPCGPGAAPAVWAGKCLPDKRG